MHTGLWHFLALATAALLCCASCLPQVSDNLLKNPSFEEGLAANGLPNGWSLYAGNGQNQAIRLVKPGDESEQAALIDDPDPTAEIGITQQNAVEGGLVYEASAMVKGVEGADTTGSYMQLRFLPSNKYFQTGLAAPSTETFDRVSVKGVAPDDTTAAVIYLYTHRDPTPKVIVDSVSLVSGVEPPPPPPPEPIPPVYEKVKDLHLTTDLVRDGKPQVTIVSPASGIYAAQASAIQAAIKAVTGAEVPVAPDDSPAAAVPLSGNLVLLGNRSTSKTLGKLYDLFYTLTDLRYPGPNGYEVRTLHNPFGNGLNAVLIGGSDTAGVAAGAEAFIAKLRQAGGGPGKLTIGRLMEIRLGDGITVPKDLKDFEVWEASAGYGSSGYFGWNSISKRMAMYYMTGDEFQAREAIRLAFPDDKAKAEIGEIDGERIEDKDDPLKGPYHYNAHMMILFWDLIEESPVFTDTERLQVTNGFSRQLNHRKDEGIYGRTEAPPYVGSRHGQYSAISLYCLARYFQKDYPNPIWAHGMEASKLEFAPLHEHAWVSGENDNLFWYDTATAPILTFLVLTGDRVPLERGTLGDLLRGQEILTTGSRGHWDLRYAALDFLHKTAYLTGDGRWLTYRDRTGMDLNVFRLGQSFWPEEALKPVPPDDLVGKWGIQAMPKPMWAWRGNGFPWGDSFLFGSYRSAVDDSGDYTLLDGFNGASRNPYHTFAILDLRLAGTPILAGYRNQVLTRADNLVEPVVAMDGALRTRDVLGRTVCAVGEVPKAAYCNWRRTLIERTGRYALVVDDLTFRTDAQNMLVQTLWETAGGAWDANEQALEIPVGGRGSVPEGWVSVRALDSPYQGEPGGEADIRRLDEIGIVLLRATEPGSWLEMTFNLPQAVSGEAFAELVGYTDRGVIRLVLDGQTVVPEYDHYATDATRDRVSLGRRDLAAGEHKLRVEVVRKREGSDKCYVGLAGFSVRPEGAGEATAPTDYTLLSADRTEASRDGAVLTMDWTGPVQANGRRANFYAIAPRIAGQEAPVCWRLADNAAGLCLPDPAVAFTAEYLGNKAEIGVIAQTHLFGRGMTEASLNGSLLRTDSPVDIDWDFASGTLTYVAPRPTQLTLAAQGPLTLDGQPLAGGQVPEGRHVIEGAKLRTEVLAGLGGGLKDLAAKARADREVALAAPPTEIKPQAPALTQALEAKVASEVVDLVTVPSAQGPIICAAEGQTVHLLDMAGNELRKLEADGKIRMVRWWPEHELLLVGCVNEHVIAYTLDGQQKWVFTSEMDPAVFRAAKTYWFKSAPGHEGIHGLFTGVFLDGKSQCFVGSACTLEIIDENGKLLHRMPIFWGPVSDFSVIAGPEGSLNLVCSQRYNGTDVAAVVNNRTLDPNPRSFYAVPAGYTDVGGWSAQNRMHIFYEDLDGDGTKEVISETNGTWNRVTVWDANGNALYDASFGPGDSIPARNMRDLDIADLNGDGKQETLAATWLGLIVALDNHCEKLWATKLPSPPTAMKVVRSTDGTPWIVAGCEDGTVLALDATGKIIRLGAIDGAPTTIAAEGTVALLGTSKGQVKGFRVGG
ncbi:MAG: VCBS repeat-containing protein [Armatimonadetes bacterium]|nr:VCBS repeat-containing protein [Armatimonadota bacterium]